MSDRVTIERYFSRDERERIEKCVAEAESRTVGEIAIVVAGRSGDYPEAAVLGGVFLGGLLSLIVTELFFHGSLWVFIPLAFVLFFPCRYLFDRAPALKTHLAGPRRRGAAVRERAVRAFYEKGLYRTRANTGVLFFLSLLERKVWVLADKGIYEKIDHETLNSFAMMVSLGMREGKAADALCRAIGGVGETLARHFPVTPDDTDELPDGVLFEKGP